MVVTRFCVMPCVMVPEVLPLARVTAIDAGGHVEKKPADDPDWDIEAVMAVVPGCPAVMVTRFVLVLVVTEAILELPTE